MLRRAHRAMGVVLALPLLLWMGTGILFHVKHRYAEAYEQLSVPAPAEPAWGEVTLAPSDLVERGLVDGGAPLRLGLHPDAGPAYFGSLRGAPAAVAAATGAAIAPADEATARRWAARAIAGSPHAARYGDVRTTREATIPSALTGRDDAAFAFHFSGGKTVTVDRLTGEIQQRGALNDWIDLTYRVHYLQWTPWPMVNVALVLVAVPVVTALALSGLSLALRRSP